LLAYFIPTTSYSDDSDEEWGFGGGAEDADSHDTESSESRPASLRGKAKGESMPKLGSENSAKPAVGIDGVAIDMK
jgi:hypothetical protein